MRCSWLAIVVVLWAAPAGAEPPDLLPPIWNPTVSQSTIRMPVAARRRRPRRDGSPEARSLTYIFAAALGAGGVAGGAALTAIGQRAAPRESPAETGAGLGLALMGGAFLVFGLSSLGSPARPSRSAAPTISLGPRSAALRLSF